MEEVRLEIFTVTHKDVAVHVKVNYSMKTVTLMEVTCGDPSKWTPKRWVFADRGLEYMKGWQNILDAMKEAVTEGTKRLEKQLAKDTAFKHDRTVRAMVAINKETNGNKTNKRNRA